MSRRKPYDTKIVAEIKKSIRLAKRRAKYEATNDYDFSTIGGQIKAARNSMGLSQVELAQKTGINQKSISEYENNIRKPIKRNMEKLKEILNIDDAPVDISYLIIGHSIDILSIILCNTRNLKPDVFQMTYGYPPENVIDGLELAIKKLEDEKKKMKL